MRQLGWEGAAKAVAKRELHGTLASGPYVPMGMEMICDVRWGERGCSG